MEKNINIQQALFFSFLRKTEPIKQKNIINISYSIMELIQVDMDRLVNIEQFPKYQYIIGWRIAFSDISGIALSY